LDEYIAPCYRIDVYDQIYSHVLQLVEGKESWPIAPNPRPFPPIQIKMPGRPKTERRREEGEKAKGNKLSKKVSRSDALCVEGWITTKGSAKPQMLIRNIPRSPKRPKEKAKSKRKSRR
jgi:hypothetical protein